MDLYPKHNHHKYPHIGTSSRTLQIRVPWIVLVAAILLTAFTAHAQRPVDKAWTILKSGLAEKSFEKRAAAARVLGLLENNSEAIRLALVALGDERPVVRAAGAKALGDMGGKSAVPKLVEGIRSEKDASVVIAGAHALVALGDPFGFAVYYAVLTGDRKSGEELLEDQRKMLKDPKKMAQFGFEQGIGFVPFGSLGYGAFKTLVKDDISPVRAAAAEVLTSDPDPKSGAALVAASSDKSWIVRAAALDALAHRGDPTVLSQIEPALADQNYVVRYTAAATFIHLSDVRIRGVPSKKR